MSAPSISGPVIRTRVAHAAPSEHHFCGHRVFSELLGDETMDGLMWLAVGGRRLSPEDRAVLQDIVVVATAGDPRIWPLKITRLVSAYGGTISAVAAGNLCLEEALIGPWGCGTAARMLVELGEKSGSAEEAASALLSEREGRVVGFGVAFREHDERVDALSVALGRRGRRDGEHWGRMQALSRVLERDRGLRPNLGVAMAAALLDLGLDPHGISVLGVALLSHLFFANAREGAEQRPAVLRELPSRHVRYEGPAPRLSPRAVLARRGAPGDP